MWSIYDVVHDLYVKRCVTLNQKNNSTQNSLGHIKLRRGTKLAKQCFDKWAHLLKQRVIRLEHAAHLRQLVLQRADTALCRWCYAAWWAGTLGPHSRKRVAARGLQRITDARNVLLHRLSEQGML
jgi:hypothetical protein